MRSLSPLPRTTSIGGIALDGGRAAGPPAPTRAGRRHRGSPAASPCGRHRSSSRRAASISRSTSSRDSTLGSGRPSLRRIERARRIVLAQRARPAGSGRTGGSPTAAAPPCAASCRHSRATSGRRAAPRRRPSTGFCLRRARKVSRSLEIGAVGRRRVQRRAALGRQHLDEGLGLARQRRGRLLLHGPQRPYAIAVSTANRRAEWSSPAWRRACTIVAMAAGWSSPSGVSPAAIGASRAVSARRPPAPACLTRACSAGGGRHHQARAGRAACRGRSVDSGRQVEAGRAQQLQQQVAAQRPAGGIVLARHLVPAIDLGRPAGAWPSSRPAPPASGTSRSSAMRAARIRQAGAQRQPDPGLRLQLGAQQQEAAHRFLRDIGELRPGRQIDQGRRRSPGRWSGTTGCRAPRHRRRRSS